LSAGNANPVTWHTAIPTAYANRVPNFTAVGAGTYYASFYDVTNDCYSTAASGAVTVTIKPCATMLSLNSTAAGTMITTPIDVAKMGNIATDVTPQGENPFTYTAVSCTSGATSTATTQGGTVAINVSTGAYTYTPATGYVGLDKFCVKVCDANVPTAICKTVTYNVTVMPKNCAAAGTVPTN
jgi:Bacterial Ig domain